MSKPKVYDFSGWATKCNCKCSDGRTILKHAFKDNDGKKVPLVWQHARETPGIVLGHAYLEERDEGVYAYCSFNNTDNGKDAKELVRHGDICALSIYANNLTQTPKKEVVHGLIREVSLVIAGANPGAFIDVPIAHSDDEHIEEAEIFNDATDQFEMFHEETPEDNPEEEPQPEDPKPEDPKPEDPKPEDPKPESEESNTDPDPNLEHQEEKKGDDIDENESVQDVINTMTPKQQNVMYFLIGAAAEEAKNGGNEDMKHNAFEAKIKREVISHGDDGKEVVTYQEETLSHAEFLEIIAECKKNSVGSMKETFLAHGVTNIENLFPEAQLVNRVPESVQRDQTWVGKVMNAVHKTPFAKVKSTYATMTADEARARGYIKGHQKQEEVIAAFKRVTPPTTIYKLQKLDRDDVIDITDFDVLAWIKGEMRGMLEEELARAILIGDGRSASSDDKIDPMCIRPIWGDDEVYTVKKELIKKENEDEYAFAKRFIREVVRARKDYKGSGNPVLYTTEDMLTDMLLIEDLNQRVIYDTIEKLKTALRVADIVTVPVMENQSRTSGDYTFKLMGILVNLKDYNVGADKGGAVALFDDFDINFNKYEYLIETRCSGALVKPYSAVVFEEKVAAASSEAAG